MREELTRLLQILLEDPYEPQALSKLLNIYKRIDAKFIDDHKSGHLRKFYVNKDIFLACTDRRIIHIEYGVFILNLDTGIVVTRMPVDQYRNQDGTTTYRIKGIIGEVYDPSDPYNLFPLVLKNRFSPIKHKESEKDVLFSKMQEEIRDKFNLLLAANKITELPFSHSVTSELIK
jgi:hypothetical protein